MFIEPHITSEKRGWIEVICGPMFSGKTEELIRRVRRAEYANKSFKIFKPQTDTRYHEKRVTSHNQNALDSIPLPNAAAIIQHTSDVEVIGIDEAQFFDEAVVGIANELAADGKRVIAAGLDMDFKGLPFGCMPSLMATAEYVTKLHAICMRCGDTATHSFRKVADEQQLLLGERDHYEARCRKCFTHGVKNLNL